MKYLQKPGNHEIATKSMQWHIENDEIITKDIKFQVILNVTQ